ncbi:MAG: alanine racemase [Gemmatimonadota bacterium]|nr:alanine racemase [Gemmatimonadota bacterium]
MSTQVPSSRAWIQVDLANLLANARTVQRAAGGAALLPVVKADAYGLGAIPVVRALEQLRPWGYAIATLDEAVALRQAGITRPLLVFTPVTAAMESQYREWDLRAVLDDPEVANAWSLPYHLEIDSGMGRCGVPWDATEVLRAFESRQLEAAFTHFYAADQGSESVSMQWERFERALASLSARPALLHAANSAGAWRLGTGPDLVRPGIFLYGGEHAPDLPRPQPVASVRAPVVSVRRVPAGGTVSYGAEWKAPRPTTVATLAIGYADGVPRHVKGRAHVVLHGKRLPIVGRVTMDFVMVDAGPESRVRIGDLATVVGTDGDHEIGIDEFAGWSDTIAYEALVRFGMRMSKEFVGP